jgi:hypothetical protein
MLVAPFIDREEKMVAMIRVWNHGREREREGGGVARVKCFLLFLQRDPKKNTNKLSLHIKI